MTRRKAFTLVELMIVVLIVGVLAAVLVPMVTARLESARWSEGKAGAGTIATAIRALYAEEGDQFTASQDLADYVNREDMQGRYFDASCYTITSTTYPSGDPLYPVLYTIQVQNPISAGSAAPGAAGTTWKVPAWTLDEKGEWTKMSP